MPFEHQPREHAIHCNTGCGRKTWNVHATCDGCLDTGRARLITCRCIDAAKSATGHTNRRGADNDDAYHVLNLEDRRYSNRPADLGGAA